MTNKTSTISGKEVEGIEPNEMYVSVMEFRSIGNQPQVQPFFRFSHNFPDDYAGEYPASYLAMRDIANELSREAQRIYNTEYDAADLPDDPDERAELVIALAQKQNETEQ